MDAMDEASSWASGGATAAGATQEDPYARLQGGLTCLAALLAETERQKEFAGTRKPLRCPALLLSLCARLRCCLNHTLPRWFRVSDSPRQSDR